MIVLTGGAGFIGSCLLRRLNDDGISDIIVVDSRLNKEKEKNLSGKKFDSFIGKERFLSTIQSNRLGKKVDTIFHLGACTSTLVMDEDYLKKNNVDYSKELAKYSLAHDIRFIYASSGATYGDGTKGFSDDDKDTIKLKPLNPYGYSKHLFDLWLIKKGLTDKVAGLKYFNVFGPNEYHKKEMRSVVAKSFYSIVKDKKMKLFRSGTAQYADGEQKRDFIYVKDAVSITYFFFKNREKCGIYNVGTGRARTWNDLAKSIFSALDFSPVIEYIDMPESLKDKYQYFTEADITKLRGSGYRENFYELEDAVKEYVGFLKEKAYL
ncbi:MAG: ADP-glyceromanno-heptose 6-epimerase [Candidatus Omnitrophica bacterium]|nr:ADP-glyceromanno-heptose 6-epimerase [Candidatus Omnitrophota bacterium]